MHIANYKELLDSMPEHYKAKRNTWHKSSLFKPYYFWNHEDREERTMFPIIYARLTDLKRAAWKLYKSKGTMIETRPLPN